MTGRLVDEKAAGGAQVLLVVLVAWAAFAWVIMLVLGILGYPVSWGASLVSAGLLGSLKVFTLALAEGLRRQ